MGLALLLGFFESFWDLIRPLHDQLADIEVVVILNSCYEGTVEAVGLELVRIEPQQLRQVITILLNFLYDLCRCV